MKNAPVFRRLLSYLKPYRKQMAAALVCVAFASAGQLIFPWLIKTLFDSVTIGTGASPISGVTLPGFIQERVPDSFTRIDDLQSLGAAVIAIALLFALTGSFQFLQNYLLIFVGQRVTTDIRIALFRHLQELSLSFYARSHTGDLVSRMTNDTSAVQSALTIHNIELIRQPVMAIGGTILLFRINPSLALLTLSVAPPIAIVARVFGLQIRHTSIRVQSHLGGITSMMNEVLAGIPILRSFTLEKFMAGKFERESNDLVGETMSVVRWRSGSDALVGFLASLALAIVLGYGGYLMLQKRMSPGDLVAFILYMQIVTTPVMGIAGIYSAFQQALAAAQRLFEVLDEKPDIVEKPDAVELPPVQGTVEFQDVTFAYDSEHPVLQGVNLKVEPGKVLALVGPSGAGKSSFVSLIPRFYDPTRGQVLIDGLDIRTVTLNSLRRQIAIVPQETYLFSVSIRENIRYGQLDASDDEIIAAAKAANAHDFITGFADGYDTLVGERGVRLSGGERQRIAIARALLKDPRILILDEATSSLDTQSEMLVQDALYRLMQGRTSFVIAHRLSTIRRADAIAVLDQGKIAEYGTHTELLERKGLYFHLYELQFWWERAEEKESPSDIGNPPSQC